jgi:hypothetical protein
MNSVNEQTLPMKKLTTFLMWSGIGLLVLTAIAHAALGLSAIAESERLGKLSSTPIMTVQELKGFWAVLSTDLLIAAAIVWYCTFRQPHRMAVVLAGSMPLVAAFVAVWFVGLHIGVVLLTLCGLLVLAGVREWQS